MIKRTSSISNKYTDSLVNTAQDEHFNIAEGIRSDVPVTNHTSVVKSINFISDSDGAYVLRPPLILKSRVTPRTWNLYDKKHILSIAENGTIAITNINDPTEVQHIVLKYYDKTIKLNELPFTNPADYVLSFLKTLISVNTFSEYTLISSKISIIQFGYYIFGFNFRHNTNYDTDLIYNVDTNYILLDNASLYRFIKIYQDMDATETTWIFEIVYPELNTLTSATNLQSMLDVNLLLENPYAIRDLYGYGYMSTTKILPYKPIGYTKSETDAHTVCRLTESVPAVINNTLQGYKLIVSASPTSLGVSPIVLKAFLTTAKTTSIYYGVWEESSNEGVDWSVCPEFISKFENNANNPLVTKKVSDLTSAEFEKVAYQDSIDQAASYLVDKQLVRLNYKMDGFNPLDLSETDLLEDRPDVLYIQSPNLSKLYRFQVYVDTLKETPTPAFLDRNYAIYVFTALNGDIEPELATYDATATYRMSGQKYVDDPDSPPASYQSAEAEILQNCVVLYPANNADILNTVVSWVNPDAFGNMLRIDCVKRSPNSYVKKIVVTIGKNDCYLDIIQTTSAATSYTSNVPKLAQKNSSITFEFESKPNNNTFYIVNRSFKSTTNSTAAYISSIKIIYALEGETQSTSVYLASTTGSFKMPYSESTVFAELLTNERKLLFTGKTYEYNNQILIFNKYSLFSSNLDSSIFSAMKTITFSTEIINTINWRNYLLVFTEKDISIVKYDSTTDNYNVRILSNSVGIPKKDANTIVCILNSVYFKSGYRVYKLVPNLYSSVDDILNVHPVSDYVDDLLETLISPEIETNNFVYANAFRYYLFIPIYNKNITYCFVFDYTKKIWNLFKYPLLINSLENLGITEEYLKSNDGIYYFKDNLDTLLNTEAVQHFMEIGYEENSDIYEVVAEIDDGEYVEAVGTSEEYSRLTSLIPKLPYVDFLYNTLAELYTFLESSSIKINDEDYTIEDTTSSAKVQMTPIMYEIDFGQKSSNYTVFKTYLETKLTLATLSEKDTFPFEIFITTDGIETPLHWDVNTDSALWKNSFSHKGTLGTLFTTDTSEYNGIMRQLIVKYSGKGKTIHHLIKGKSKYNFKFYSMDVRSRILPKKQ